MRERPVGLDLPGADLPGADALRLTDVLPAALAVLDGGLPGADAAARDALGLDGGADQLLVVLVDGLGLVPLMDRLGHAPVLRSLRDEFRTAHTVAPSTTAAAITAFGTGAFPGATRMTGYSVLYDYRVMNLLAFEGGPVVEEWQALPTLFEGLAGAGVDSAVVSPSSFAGSGLTRAALRGARHVGALSLDDRCDAALRELRAGTRVVYLYWSQIDHVGHAHGLASPQWEDALEELDGAIGALIRRAGPRVRMVLTADHGMVDVAASGLIDVAGDAALSDGVLAIAGETRAVHLHAEPGRADEVVARWREVLGERAWIVGSSDLAAVLGEGPGADTVGDALVFMRGRHGVVDSRTQSAHSIAMPGVHGSLTSDEMLIPVLPLT
ncbi:alkaline phosphatase family protein [Actinomyces sp. B33]|uniref:alkaline phosphatase family protein n=1 Tax=Actinomyces sp. B33 TaxID=2942131 RepID=UPI002341AD89|nr:nucleotide pyrophosphatase/phosphodiesterase family protein [Actinomyces sp. B33]MDC4233185.1 alkaline phosphatase family protein [Actinomyces sp. B33]